MYDYMNDPNDFEYDITEEELDSWRGMSAQEDTEQQRWEDASWQQITENDHE
jgi:hypothetical protein